MTVHVLLVAHNSRAVIARAIEPLAGADGVELTVVDNASDDGTAGWLRTAFPAVRVIDNAANDGFAAAANLAAASTSPAPGDFFLLLNPDARLGAGALRELVARLEADPGAAIAAPLLETPGLRTLNAGHPPTIRRMAAHASGASRLARILPALAGHYLMAGPGTAAANPPGTEPGGTADGPPARPGSGPPEPTGVPVGWVTGGCLLVRSDVWARLGGLTTRWFMYAEDVDFCLRARDAGWRVLFFPDIRAHHAVGGSSRGVDGRAASAWVVHLYELYVLRTGAGPLRRGLWKGATAGGFLARELAYRARGAAGVGTADHAYQAARFRRFRTDLLAAVPPGRTDCYRGPQGTARGASDRKRRGVSGGTMQIRIIPELRAAHVERNPSLTPARTLYFGRMYDLAGEPPATFERVRLAPAAWLLLRSDASVLEVPEPLWLRFLPRTAVLVAAWRLGGALAEVRGGALGGTRGGRRGGRHVVTYAIENNDPRLLLRTGIPGRAAAGALAWLIGWWTARNIDRIAYGSAGARAAYAALPGADRVPARTLPELPAPRAAVAPRAAAAPSASAAPRSAPCGAGAAPRAVFVGDLSARKGVPELLAAWERVEPLLLGARLDVVGGGALAADVAAWAAAAPRSRRFRGLLPHDEALRVLGESTVLVAPSRRHGRWREQIGLPITEALALGLTVVTTDETGLADWLRAAGHGVLPSDPPGGPADPGALADAVVRALREPLPRDRVLGSLPGADARAAADRWLHAVGDAP
ncbi:glycosyltransferase [Arthrobacter halodurans]|uniref:Glycosyltransferase n=1 Tax=Arthrobacter halodurans TaxID=516699 RepID=A0ABV4UKT1_9MICC